MNTPNLVGQMVRGATPNVNEMAPGGAATQTVSFSNGSYLQSTVTTSNAGGHNHTISGQTGGVTAVNLGDPGEGNYFVREWQLNSYSDQAQLIAEPRSASSVRGEGNHRHDASGLIVSAAPGHEHTVTLPGLTGTQTLDNLPPHINLLKICRTR